jgi:UDP-N-acetylglucosamine transferase subunit ALG13
VAIEQEIIKGNINEPVVAQVGTTVFHSKHIKTIGLLSMDDFSGYIKKADLIICHAGYGILTAAAEAQKKIIAAARLADYGEHVNNHQLQILDDFEKKGYLLALRDFNSLGELLNKIKLFVPRPLVNNSNPLKDLICEFIQGN